MMQQLRAHTERANAASALLGNAMGFTTTGTTFAWTSMPCVPATAICTHGKRYERRPQEMLT